MSQKASQGLISPILEMIIDVNDYQFMSNYYLFIDKYIYGTSSRISPEAPVPVITYIDEKETIDSNIDLL